MCTELEGKAPWFLPFDQGWNDGAGNPPNPYGIQTDFFWKRIFTPRGLTDIIENYAQIVEEKNPKTGRKTEKQLSPATSSWTSCTACWPMSPGTARASGI